MNRIDQWRGKVTRAVWCHKAEPFQPRRSNLQFKVKEILDRANEPVHSRAESDFEKLQSKWPPYPPYGYDALSTWTRAVERSQKLLQVENLAVPGRKILDVGTGDGMLGVLLGSYGHKVTLTDLEDWRNPRAMCLDFIEADSCVSLPFEKDQFDLVSSFNTFEHLADPRAAFEEIIRVVRPGGFIYLEFGPLYTGPWGLHAYRTLKMPYPQFLFSEGFTAEKLHHLGIEDLGQERQELQYLNKWKASQFKAVFETPSCEVALWDLWTNENCLPMILDYPEAFSGRALTFKDVTAAGIKAILKKNE